jgi:hypothetical protein
MSEKPISPLRRRKIEDMSIRKFGEKTQHNYIRHIETFDPPDHQARAWEYVRTAIKVRRKETA